MSNLIIRGEPPAEALVEAIYAVAAELDIWECYAHEGRYHFALGGGWSLALSSDSADRIRVETCSLTRPTDTMWVVARHHDRLAGLALRMSAVSQVA